jgi:transcription elongation factor Elf1
MLPINITIFNKIADRVRCPECGKHPVSVATETDLDKKKNILVFVCKCDHKWPITHQAYEMVYAD